MSDVRLVCLGNRDPCLTSTTVSSYLKKMKLTQPCRSTTFSGCCVVKFVAWNELHDLLFLFPLASLLQIFLRKSSTVNYLHKGQENTNNGNARSETLAKFVTPGFQRSMSLKQIVFGQHPASASDVHNVKGAESSSLLPQPTTSQQQEKQQRCTACKRIFLLPWYHDKEVVRWFFLFVLGL